MADQDLFDIPERTAVRPPERVVTVSQSDKEVAIAEEGAQQVAEEQAATNQKPFALDVLQNFETNSLSAGIIDWSKDNFVYDKTYNLDQAELTRLTKDIPEEFHENFDSAVNRDHAETIRTRMLKEIDNRKDLSEMGLGEMMAVELLTIGLDTPAMVAEFMVPGLTRGTKAMRFAQGAAGNAAVGAAIEAGVVATSLTENHQRTAIAAGLGAIIGGPLAVVLGRASSDAGRVLADDLAGQNQRFGIGDNSAGPASIGAGADDPLRASADKAFDDFNLADDALAAPVHAAGARGTLSAQLNRSQSPLAQRAGHRLVPEAVGHKGGVVQATTTAEMADVAVDRTLVKLNKVNNSALREWMQETGQVSIGSRYRPAVIAKFDDVVDQEMRGINTGSKAAKKVAAVIREVNDDLGRRGEEAGVLTRNRDFTLARQFDETKVRTLTDEYGKDQVEALIAKAFRQANKVAEDVAMKFARVYLRTIREKGASLHPRLATAGADDLDGIADILRAGDAGDDLILEVRTALEAAQGDSQFTFAKGRSLLDESVTTTAQSKHTGLAGELTFRDILRTGGRSLTESHVRNVEGAIAMSRTMNIKSPGDMDRFFTALRAQGADLNIPGKAVEKDVDRLTFAMDGIMGRANRSFGQDPDSLVTHFGRTIRDLNFLRMGPRFGLASVPETANLIGQGSARLLMERVPVLGGFIRGMRNGTPDALDLAREIEELNGIGQMRQTHVPGDRFEETQILGHINTQKLAGKAIDSMQGFTQGGRRMVAEWSGLSGITDVEQSVAASFELQRLMKLAARNRPLGKRNKQLMGELGLDDAMTDRVLEGLRTHSKMGRSVDGKRNIRIIDHDAFERADADAYAALSAGTYRKARRLIQAQDLGVTIPQLQRPLAQAVTQFRTFGITAYEKQLLQGIYNFDAPRAIGMVTSFGIAMLAYTAVTGLEYGHDKKELKKRMSMGNLVASSMNRMGAASLAPAVYDTLAPFAGMDPMFSYGRPSGLASNFITGNPTVDLFDRAARVAGLPGQLVGDPARQFSQADVRDMRRMAPFIGTLFGMNRIVSSFTDKLPEQRRNPRIARREKARKERDGLFN